MSGHSKWANIQHRKGRQDAKRGKIFTKAAKEIIIAAKGGSDPVGNSRLRAAIAAAKAVNLPKDKIEAAIRKGTGEDAGGDLTETFYEGYGPGGIAVMVEVATDNKNRTVAEVRHAFSKHGGNLGTEGSVAFQFKHVGQLIFAPGTDEDKVMEIALEAGAEDVISDEEGAIEVLTAPGDFETVKNALEAAGFKADLADVTMRPDVSIAVEGDDALRMQKLLDVLEDLDDVQEVYHNAEL